jgi:hypothetical protein
VYKGFSLQAEALSRLPSYDDAIADRNPPRSFVYSLGLPAGARPGSGRPPPYNPAADAPEFDAADLNDNGGDGQGGGQALLQRRQLSLQMTQAQLRITKTYLYVAGGLALAGASAAVATRVGGGVAVRHPWLVTASTVASLMGILLVDPQKVSKHVYLSSHFPEFPKFPTFCNISYPVRPC